MQDLYPYYERELQFIRQMSGEFASRYPKVAGRLQLGKGESADPHVERLIEAFALLAGRVQHKIDDEFPEVTESLLGILYPHYLRPIPSLAIAQFGVDPSQSAPTGATKIETGTALHSRPVSGSTCTFRTVYPVTLWPLRVEAAKLSDPGVLGAGIPSQVPAVIQVRLETLGGLPLNKLPLRSLRFYLNADGSTANLLYELLLLSTIQVVVRENGSGSSTQRILGPEALQAVGFNTNESVLPYSDQSFSGYRLLQEYFHFPEKFLFVDLSGLNFTSTTEFRGSSFDLYFCLGPIERPERLAKLEQSLKADTFQLGCTPIVNLFERVAEPIRLTHTKTEYRVVPDQHRQLTTEVYSVDKVTSTAPYMEQPSVFEPFYSFRHNYSDTPTDRFWYSHRRPSFRKDDPGTEVYLTLVDLDFQPSLPSTEMLTARITCTNRDLPGRLQWSGEWGELNAEGQGLCRVRYLRKPTKTLRPPLRRGLQWRLISHLGLNHLSITGGGLQALQEILRLYDFSEGEDSFVIHRHIAGIVDLQTSTSMSRVQSDTGVAFCRGIDVMLEFDEDQYAGSGVFLMASVLERFLGLYAAINSFSRLSIKTKQRRGVLKQWVPLAGEQRIL